MEGAHSTRRCGSTTSRRSTARLHRAACTVSTRCASQVQQAAQAAGLLVDELMLDADEVSCDMMLEFEAMSERWLGSIGEAKRRQVMDRARELGRAATFRVHTVRIRVTKPAAAAGAAAGAVSGGVYEYVF